MLNAFLTFRPSEKENRIIKLPVPVVWLRISRRFREWDGRARVNAGVRIIIPH